VKEVGQLAVRLIKKKTPLSPYTTHQVKDGEIIVTKKGKKPVVIKIKPRRR